MALADTWMHGGVGWGWMALMMILMVLFWAAVIFGIFWLVRTTVDRRPEARTDAPLEVLERRFAEGAITEEDYRARREILLNGAVGSNDARKDQQLAVPRM
jgi:uncharacterized membrane protein